ncbi:MAG: hypothetical protein NC388_04170 [Clostridium sp.]|nr:hypothetical protein [Clostridium sp.]
MKTPDFYTRRPLALMYFLKSPAGQSRMSADGMDPSVPPSPRMSLSDRPEGTRYV